MPFRPGESQNMLAYAEDTVGRRQYTLRVKNLATGETLTDLIPNVSDAVGRLPVKCCR